MKESLYISFHVTADSIACRLACEENNIVGKLVPVPRSMSAGCGMAWKTEVAEEDIIRKLLGQKDIEWDQMKIL